MTTLAPELTEAKASRGKRQAAVKEIGSITLTTLIPRSATPAPAAPPVQVAVEYITAQMAREILSEHKFERQRKMRDLSLSRYGRAMKMKDFKPGTPLHIGIRPDKGGFLYYLLDGQHRLESVARTGEAQWFVCIFHSVNSVNEILAAQNMAHEMRLKPKHLKTFNAATRLIVTGFDDGSRAMYFSHFDAVLDLMHLLRDAAEGYLDAIEGGVPNVNMRLHAAPVMAVGLITFHYSLDIAKTFWRDIAQDDGLRQGDPRKVLVEYLKDTNVHHEKDGVYARKVAYCWNAQVDGRTIPSTIKNVKEKAPIEIKGTPYDGASVLYYTDDQVFKRFKPEPKMSITELLATASEVPVKF